MAEGLRAAQRSEWANWQRACESSSVLRTKSKRSEATWVCSRKLGRMRGSRRLARPRKTAPPPAVVRARLRVRAWASRPLQCSGSTRQSAALVDGRAHNAERRIRHRRDETRPVGDPALARWADRGAQRELAAHPLGAHVHAAEELVRRRQARGPARAAIATPQRLGAWAVDLLGARAVDQHERRSRVDHRAEELPIDRVVDAIGSAAQLEWDHCGRQ